MGHNAGMGRPLVFLASVGVLALLLWFSPVPSERVAEFRLQRMLHASSAFPPEVFAACRTLKPREGSRLEKVFVASFSPLPSSETGPDKECELSVATSRASHYGIQEHWRVLPILTVPESAPLAGYSFAIDFPLPIVLLPLLAFLLSLALPTSLWSFKYTLASYVFLLSGGNLIGLTQDIWRVSQITLKTDTTFLSLSVILLWVTLYRHGGEVIRRERRNDSKLAKTASRIVGLVAGLWSPVFYTAVGKVLFPWRVEKPKQLPFLSSQLLLSCLSLYLLSFQFSEARKFLEGSLLLPRYFTFSALVLVAISLTSPRARSPLVLWNLPRFWRHFFAVLAVEVLATQTSLLGDIPTLLRISSTLLMCELLRLRRVPVRPVLYEYLPLFGTVFGISTLGMYVTDSGMLDLALVLWDPQKHPTGYVFFTFLAGTAMGFLTGSFSATFTALFSLMITSYDVPLVKAALLDGVLAGSLLSPLSLYNLIPKFQFGLSLRELTAFRFQQLGVPLLIGMIIYAISAVNSVAILRPATFVFLCLVAFTWQLRRSQWHVGKIKELLD